MWNISDFGDLEDIYVHASKVWKPELLLNNKWEYHNIFSILTNQTCASDSIVCTICCHIHYLRQGGNVFILSWSVSLSVCLFNCERNYSRRCRSNFYETRCVDKAWDRTNRLDFGINHFRSRSRSFSFFIVIAVVNIKIWSAYLHPVPI